MIARYAWRIAGAAGFGIAAGAVAFDAVWRWRIGDHWSERIGLMYVSAMVAYAFVVAIVLVATDADRSRRRALATVAGAVLGGVSGLASALSLAPPWMTWNVQVAVLVVFAIATLFGALLAQRAAGCNRTRLR